MVVRILSVNVGTPQDLSRDGEKVLSAIVKSPFDGPVMIRKLNLDGDRQADLSVHGGEAKAVYAYPSEHYGYWREKFPAMQLRWGAFGENLTTEGVLERGVRAGDRLSVGSAVLEVTRPRFPCFKLGMRFGTSEMIKWFLDSERSGFYLRVLREGTVQAGDEIDHTVVNRRAQTITAMVRSVKSRRG